MANQSLRRMFLSNWIQELQPAIWAKWHRRAVAAGSTLVPALEPGDLVIVDQVHRSIPEDIQFEAMIGYHPFERFEAVSLRLVRAEHGRAAFEGV